MKFSALLILVASSAFSTAVAANEESPSNVGKIHIDFKIFKAAYTRNNGGRVTTVTTTITQPVTVTVSASAAPTGAPATATATSITSVPLPTVGDVTSVTGTKGETVVATIIGEISTSTTPGTTTLTPSSIELITNVVTRTPSWIPVRPSWTWKKPSQSPKPTSPVSSSITPVEISSVSSSSIVVPTLIVSSAPPTIIASTRSISWKPVRPSWTWEKPITKITSTNLITMPTSTKPVFTPSNSIKYRNSTKSSRPPWTWTKPRTSISVILTTAPLSSDSKTWTTRKITRTAKDTPRRPSWSWATKSPKPTLSTGFSSGTTAIPTPVASSSVKYGNNTTSIVKPSTKSSRPPWTWVKPSTTVTKPGASLTPIPTRSSIVSLIRSNSTSNKSTRPPWTWIKPTTKPTLTGISTTIINSVTGKPTSIPLSSAPSSNSTLTLISTTRSKSTRSIRPPWTWTKPTTKLTTKPTISGTGVLTSVPITSVKYGNSTATIRTPTVPSSRPPWTWSRPGTSSKPTGTGGLPITSIKSSTRTRPSFIRPSFTRTRSFGTGIPTKPSSTKSGNYLTTTTTLTVQLPDQTITVTLSSTTTLVTKTTMVTLPPGATITHFTTRHFTVPESGDWSSDVGTSKEVISARPGTASNIVIRTLTSLATLSIPGAVVTRVVPGTETIVTATASLVPRAEEDLVDGVKVVTLTKTVSTANGQETKCTKIPEASGKQFVWPGLVEWIRSGGKKDKE